MIFLCPLSLMFHLINNFYDGYKVTHEISFVSHFYQHYQNWTTSPEIMILHLTLVKIWQKIHNVCHLLWPPWIDLEMTINSKPISYYIDNFLDFTSIHLDTWINVLCEIVMILKGVIFIWPNPPKRWGWSWPEQDL